MTGCSNIHNICHINLIGICKHMNIYFVKIQKSQRIQIYFKFWQFSTYTTETFTASVKCAAYFNMWIQIDELKGYILSIYCKYVSGLKVVNKWCVSDQ